MRKSLIALAILGSFGGEAAAAAQSSVTLYGSFDVGYGKTNGGMYEVVPSHFQQLGEGNSATQWGLKGSEDLGGGVKVNFNLNQGLDSETGNLYKNGQDYGFNRKAWVGLSGGFGEVRMGRQKSVPDNLLGEFDVSGDPDTGAAYGNAGISATGDSHSSARRDSEIVYLTPTISGFSGELGYVNKYDQKTSLQNSHDDTDPSSIKGEQVWGLGGLYTYGGLSLGAAYESKLMDSSLSQWGASSGAWAVGAKYDFGSFVVITSYADNHYRNDGKGYGLGVAVPFGAFTVGTQVAYNYKAYVVNPDTKKAEKYKPLAGELFATYAFSKRTTAYMDYGRIDGDAKTYLAASDKNSWALGLMHRF